MTVFQNPALRKVHPAGLVHMGLSVFILGNVNATVDHFLHPEVPYFDQDHLIVGVITSGFSLLLFGGAYFHFRYLLDVLRKLPPLEKFLPICSYCKKIRIEGGAPEEPGSWKPVEAYISERTASHFTHGICPDCMTTHFPEVAAGMKK